MKVRLIAVVIFAGCLQLGLLDAAAELEVSADVSIHDTSEFYEPLAPSGTWIEIDSYGRCWHPAQVDPGWRPYCNGHWEWTDDGWYWVSDEPWAWACYHYGSWVDDPRVGWCWVPGVEWAPAWVNWRSGGDHIGWAPCGPPGFVVQPSYYVFVDNRHFHERIRPDTVIVNNETIIKNTTVIKNVRRENREIDGKSKTVIVNEGPNVTEIEKASGHQFNTVSVSEVDRQSSALIPEKLRRRDAAPSHQENKSAPNVVQQLPATVAPEQPRFVPDRNKPDNVRPNKDLLIPPQQTIPQERTIPQNPPERIVPSPDRKKESPENKDSKHVKEIIPPQPPPPPAPAPDNSTPNQKGQGKDKDHGQQNP